MDIFLLRPLYALIVNTSNTTIKLAKHQSLALANPRTDEIIHIKKDERFMYLPPQVPVEFIHGMHYKPISDRPQQMERHEMVQHHEDERLNWNWQDKVTVAVKYEQPRPEFLKHLEERGIIWYGPLGRILTAKDRIELTYNNLRIVHSAPYGAGPKARQFVATAIDCTLQEDVIERVTTEWAIPILVAPKKDGSLQFCFDYRKLNAVTIIYFYMLPRMDKCIDLSGEATVFSRLDANLGYWWVDISEDNH